MFSVFSFHVLCPPSCRHELCSPAFKVLPKIGDEFVPGTLVKNSGRFNLNLSRETFFLATTLLTKPLIGAYLAMDRHVNQGGN